MQEQTSEKDAEYIKHQTYQRLFTLISKHMCCIIIIHPLSIEIF